MAVLKAPSAPKRHTTSGMNSFPALAQRGTPYSRAVDDFARRWDKSQLGAAASPNECAGWLRPLICGRRIPASELRTLVNLASVDELAALRADRLTAERIDETLGG